VLLKQCCYPALLEGSVHLLEGLQLGTGQQQQHLINMCSMPELSDGNKLITQIVLK